MKETAHPPLPTLRPPPVQEKKNPTKTLLALLGAACAGLLALTLVAQTPPPPPRENPLQAIHAHVCGFHFYSGDMKRALRADHYCSHVSEDVFQCVIYDSAARNARLIGVEYIISEARFNRLPADEKKLWHSHRYEVMSGQLTAPDLADAAEHALMQDLVSTYGKTWHLWQVDRGDELPLGLPQLMMGFTADGQADPKMIAARDRELRLDSAQLKAKRADLPTRPIAPGADGWQHGPAFQLSGDLSQSAPPAAKPSPAPRGR